ncbi:MAG: hypothetical protein ACNA7V_02725 [Bacteroidales bacterium]
MKTRSILKVLSIIFATGLLMACERTEIVEPKQTGPEDQFKAGNKGNGFVHGILLDIDGEDYYFAGPQDGPNGESDVPGHYWNQTGKDVVVGKHYNTGPFGAESWWSSNAGDGKLLYMVHGRIDEWTPEKAENYADQGYVHYHEFVSVATGEEHPTKVIWLKHTAVDSFTLDGGPGAPNPPYQHEVTPGIDFQFPNNYMMPYNP